MKYLSKKPMVFGPPSQTFSHMKYYGELLGAMYGPNSGFTSQRVDLIKESGGRSHKIPKKDRCASGRHNKRLTECLCGL